MQHSYILTADHQKLFLPILAPWIIDLCIANGDGGGDMLARYLNARGGVWQHSSMVGKSKLMIFDGGLAEHWQLLVQFIHSRWYRATRSSNCEAWRWGRRAGTWARPIATPILTYAQSVPYLDLVTFNVAKIENRQRELSKWACSNLCTIPVDWWHPTWIPRCYFGIEAEGKTPK